MPLPVAAELGGLRAVHRQRHDPVYLRAVRLALVILAPGCLFGEAQEVRAGDVVVMADLARRIWLEEAFRVVRVGLRLRPRRL